MPNDPHRLAFAPAPAIGESIHGYMGRLAEANGYAEVAAFASALGLGASVGPLSRDRTWQRLGEWTGLPPPALDALRWRRVTTVAGRGMVDFLGMRIALQFLSARRPRACRACLAADGIHRDLWAVSHVLACPAHACRLSDYCPDCDRRPARAAAWRCDCGGGDAAADPARAPDEAVRVARELAALFGKDRTGVAGDAAARPPAPFDGLDANDLLMHLAVLGAAADHDDATATALTSRQYRATAPTPSCADALERLRSAVRIMEGWPGSLDDVLRDVEARGAALSGTGDDFTLAFSSPVGRMLRHPPRGSDGLPLRLIHEAVDAYWRGKGRARRQRNITVKHASALRLHVRANAARLAGPECDGRASPMHRRVLARVHEGLSDAERALPTAQLEAVVGERFHDLLTAAEDTISGHAARRMLEGDGGKETLAGWDEPGLLPLEPRLQGLRFQSVPGYAAASARDALARLRAVASPVVGPGLVPLMGVAIRTVPLRTWYCKPDLLHDVLSGALPVFAEGASPRLGDLLVHPDALAARIDARDPALASGPTAGFACLRAANRSVRARTGRTAGFSLDEARRLARSGVVGVRLRTSRVAGRVRPVVERLYNVDDMVTVASSLADAATAPGAKAALGEPIDCAQRLLALRDAGNSLRAVGRALWTAGVRTTAGAPWSHSAVAKALARCRAGLRVEGVVVRPQGVSRPSAALDASTGPEPSR